VKNIGNVVILIGIVLFCFILQMYVFNNFKIFCIHENTSFPVNYITKDFLVNILQSLKTQTLINAYYVL